MSVTFLIYFYIWERNGPMHITGRNISHYFIFLALIWFSSITLRAQQITDNQIKAGYIYNFQKNLTWENENKTDTFTIGIYGGDPELISVFKSMEQLVAKNKPIRILPFKSTNEIVYTDILYISNNLNFFVKDISEIIKGRNTLLVTDRCEYQRYVMINFIYNENSKILFEINSKNLEESRFQITPKLILLGGSEIDVRKLYIATEKSLSTEKEKVESFEKELILKKQEIQNMNTKLALYYDEIENLQNKISTQKNELNILTNRSHNQKLDLEEKSYILLNQKNEILNREKSIIKKDSEIKKIQKEINNYSFVLLNQKAEIDKRQLKIKEQERTLNNQLERIKTQQTFLYLLVALVFMAVLLAFVIYRNYNINRIRNLELEKLSIVARETDNAVIIMNEKGDFEWVNEGFTRMYGYDLQEFIEKFGKNILQTSSFKTINEVLETISIKKKSMSYESSSYNIEGNIIWTQSTITPILDELKNIKKLIVIDSDITALKEAEFHIIEKNEEIQTQSEELFTQTEQLLTLNKELVSKKDKLEDTLKKLKSTQSQLVESEKMVILGQLTAGIAHEINNPVNFINSGIDCLKIAYNQITELLDKYEQLTAQNAEQQLQVIAAYKDEINYKSLLEEIEQIVKDIRSGVYRTIEIIKSLRTFSRLDESDLKPVDLHKSIDSTLVILKNKFHNRIDIIKEYGDIPLIECYPGKINQLLLNILVNAIQAIDGNGKIYIKTALKIKENIENIEISIKDTGAGMSEEVRKKIFEPFFTTKEAGEGTGLGLSISQNIIENHHGTINVESYPGAGSLFKILLPVEFKKKNKSIIFEEK